MSNETFDYLVLSHMWGKQHAEQIQLLDSNLASYQIDIPWEQLCASPVYKEAIRITWTLGYQYLWIDSLCIIQKSESDWQHEAGRMAIVYGNAVCNISTLFSPQDVMATIERADPRDWSPCILREATSTRPGLYIERTKPASDLPPWLIQAKWPLFNRAWTFQEYLLSPRTLLVGHTNLMFQCSELFYDELLGPLGDGNGMFINEEKSTKATGTDFGKTKYFPAALTRIASTPDLSSVAVLLFIEDWLKVFNEYRARNLSYASDRIVAFAGIARAFSHLGHLTYLAGAWKECLPLCLLWHLDKKPTNIAMEDNNLPHAADMTYTPIIHEHISTPSPVPSWSWFSTPIYKYHNLHLLLCTPELSLRRKANLNPQTLSFTPIFFAKTQSFHFPTQPKNHFPSQTGFADFKKLRITLSTRTLPTNTNLPADLSSQLGYIQHFPAHPDDADFDCEPVFTYYHDDIIRPRRNPPRNALLALMAEIQIVRVGGKYGVQRILAGLVLVPREDEGTWKRVGVWKGWLVRRVVFFRV
ncbi:HET-domain-containing protein [Plenodomus tracheiphilus IPT5]|uniref:HET-domain-containing protein n=1 Tax=Plenodomus tracheiphilus IPT5 TaxID=1408161 RepID=A0A6A7B7D9_9PLEO|nr:HET-domain-containing protein [Plenodomus tracheiphilus IPT5]